MVTRILKFFAVFKVLSLIHNFNAPTKLLSDLYLNKFLDTSVKLSF